MLKYFFLRGGRSYDHSRPSDRTLNYKLKPSYTQACVRRYATKGAAIVVLWCEFIIPCTAKFLH